MKLKITHDVYNISNRVRKIDNDYYIVYDTSKCNYQLHHSKQRGGSYCLTIPFAQLDARTLDYVNKTKSENVKEIIKEIDKQNLLKENAEKTSALNKFNQSIENMLKRR